MYIYKLDFTIIFFFFFFAKQSPRFVNSSYFGKIKLMALENMTTKASAITTRITAATTIKTTALTNIFNENHQGDRYKN